MKPSMKNQAKRGGGRGTVPDTVSNTVPNTVNRTISSIVGGAVGNTVGRMAGALLPVLAIVSATALGGCSQSIFQSTDAGLAGGDAQALTLVVAQTRAQFPNFSAGDLDYAQRPAPEEQETGEPTHPQPVLQGRGRGVSQGVQKGKAAEIQVRLFLRKPDYGKGYLSVTRGKAKPERWPVLAFDRQGEAAGRFEFLYLLLAPGGKVRYLALIGGTYKKGGNSYRAIEGTLVELDEKKGLTGWKRGFKFDFGFKQPLQPEHQTMVAEARRLFRSLARRVKELGSLRGRVAELEEEVGRAPPAAQRTGTQGGQAPPATAGSPPPDPKLAEARVNLEVLRGRLRAEGVAAAGELTEYYGLRRKIAPAYTAFTKTNGYSWVPAKDQQRVFDQWKVVELHHPRIDDISEKVLGTLEQPDSLRALRKKSLEEVGKFDNWSKNPAQGWRPGS